MATVSNGKEHNNPDVLVDEHTIKELEPDSPNSFSESGVAQIQ